jgi:hypothetical protein
VADVLFKGGPCAGQHSTVDADKLGTGTVLCGGINYHLYDIGDGEFLALLPGANPPNENATAQPTATGAPDDVLSAWHALSRAYGHGVAEHVNRTIRLRRSIRRVGLG